MRETAKHKRELSMRQRAKTRERAEGGLSMRERAKHMRERGLSMREWAKESMRERELREHEREPSTVHEREG